MRKLITFGCALAIAGAIVIGQTGVTDRPLCLSVILFGRECPGCGMTRSFAAMGRGDFATATALNPLGPLLLGAAVAMLLVQGARRLAPRFRYWFEVEVGVVGGVFLAAVVRIASFYFL